MLPQPTLSVLMTNYNHAHFLPESLGAILAQSYRPMEIIVIDDCSTDNSVEVIESFAREEPRLRLVRNERNQGVNHNANRLLKLSSGEYIYYGAADDKILPGLFEKSMKLLARYPQAALCCTESSTLFDATGIVSELRFYISDQPRYWSPGDVVELSRHTEFFIAANTAIIKRSALLKVGGFIPELGPHCDWVSYNTIAFRQGICFVPEPLAMIRAMPTTYSASVVSNWSGYSKMLKYMLDLLKSPAYQDVYPMFRRSEGLGIFGLKMLRVILSHPKHLDFLTPRLMLRFGRQALSMITPAPARRLYRCMRNRYSASRLRKSLTANVSKGG